MKAASAPTDVVEVLKDLFDDQAMVGVVARQLIRKHRVCPQTFDFGCIAQRLLDEATVLLDVVILLTDRKAEETVGDLTIPDRTLL